MLDESLGIRKKVVSEVQQESQRVQNRIVSMLEEKLRRNSPRTLT